MLKQKLNHVIVQSTCERLLTDKKNARMHNSFISQEKDKEQSQKCKENMLLKTYLCHLGLKHVST